MVRLVFRPYTQLRRSICTSESLRSSIRVSPDFNLARHSSPSFGSQRACSCCSARSEVEAKRRDCAQEGIVPKLQAAFAFTAPLGLGNPMTRTHVRLLGPCFKTGRRRRRPTRDREANGARRALAVRVRLNTRRLRSQEQGAQTLGNELHPRPRSRSSGSSREEPEKCSQGSQEQTREALAGQTRESQDNPSMNLRLRLRERLRLPLHSFTYS